MKTILRLLIIILICLVFGVSCTSKEDIETIHRAETLLDSHPDSAYQLLHTIQTPARLNKKDYMKYVVLNVLAKYKTYREIKEDTIVLQAVFYFDKKNDSNEKALANYAAASVMNESGRYKKAMEYYKQAEQASEDTHNKVLKGLIYENIAFLYDREFLLDEAILYYKKAYNVYPKSIETTKKRISVLTYLGADYFCKQESDSALIYYKSAYKEARKTNDTESQPMLLNNIGLVYKLQGKYALAISDFKNAILKVQDENLKFTYLLNLTSVYILVGKMDSVQEHITAIEKSIQSSQNLSYKAAATDFLARYYKSTENYKKSLSFLELNKAIHDKIFSENQSKALIEADKKFDFTFHKAEAEKAKLNWKITILAYTGVALLLIVIGLLIRNRYKQKEIQYTFEKNALEFRQNAQATENKNLQNELSRFKFMNSAFYTILSQTNSLHSEINDILQAGILHEKSDRHKIIQQKLKNTQDTLKDNIALNANSFLKDKALIDEDILNQLNEKDKIILTMLFYKASRKDIADILSITPQAVYNKIPRLKKKLISKGVHSKIIDLLFEKDTLSL